jgi:hypothetical protein
MSGTPMPFGHRPGEQSGDEASGDDSDPEESAKVKFAGLTQNSQADTAV